MPGCGMRSQTAQRHPLLPYGFITLFYMLLGLEIRTRVTSPDWPYFVDLLNRTLHGNPFTIYSTRVFEFHTFAYGPLSLWLMAPFKLLSEALGAPPPLEAWLVWLPLFFADILSGLLLVRLVRRWRPIAPDLLPFVYGFYLLSWLVIFASPVHSHFESLLLAFLLLAIMSSQRRNYILAGILSGAALLTKQSAIVVVLPHIFILWRAAGPGPAFRYTLATGLTGLIALAPYLIADFDNVIYMALRLPGLLPVAYQSLLPIWKRWPDLYAFLVDYSNAIIVVLILVASLLAVLRRHIAIGSPQSYALYALAALFMLDLEKWALPHFFVLPFALLLLWEIGRGRLPLSALLLASGVTAMYILDADVSTAISFSYLLAPLALLLFALTAQVAFYLFGDGATSRELRAKTRDKPARSNH